MKITVSVIKADIGSLIGHREVFEECKLTAKSVLQQAKDNGLLIDFHVTACGDDLELIMTHTKGVDNPEIHKVAWVAFNSSTEISKKYKLYAAGQDILSETFSGNIKGLGPGVAEIEFEERLSEPILIFMADKTEPGAWNYFLYKVFADPFNTVGLVIDPKMHNGFIFEVLDLKKDKIVKLASPEELYDLLALIGQPGRFVVKSVERKDGLPAAVASTQRLSLIAGRYVGKDDPVCIVRAQHGLPAVGEILEPFANPWYIAGWMRGSHHGPLMPCPVDKAKPSRFDGPPRVICLGFQLCEGKLIGPTDMFDDPAFDLARQKVNEMADIMRRHGPFEPHRVGESEMEYTTLPEVLEKLKKRFE
jgi:fructose 1,6-bisphosphate aldolase/phosphatase